MKDFKNYQLKTLEYCSFLNNKLKRISDSNFIYARAYSNELETILYNIKNRILFVSNNGHDTSSILNDINTLEILIKEFKKYPLITNDIINEFENIKKEYFKIEEYSAIKYNNIVKNICEINNIKIKNSFNCYIIKLNDGWEISYPKHSYFVDKTSLLFGIFHILLFNEEKPIRQSSYYNVNNDEKNIIIAKCITHIFYPDDLFLYKAKQLNYDTNKLSKFFDFSESLIKTKINAIKKINI